MPIEGILILMGISFLGGVLVGGSLIAMIHARAEWRSWREDDFS